MLVNNKIVGLIILLLLCSFISIGRTSGGKLADRYISTYKEIAISEMHRSGIPASIKLAQGLLESDWGRSDLATIANNHFGIKCGSQWKGEVYAKEDDDRDRNGNLIMSCFRSYDNAYDSYIAHTDFLMDSRKDYRYGFLFEYDHTDYRKWAKGLLKAGYATDKKYPKKLIQIIEQYELFLLDQMAPVDRDNYLTVHHSKTKDIAIAKDQHFSKQSSRKISKTPSQKNKHTIDEKEGLFDIALQYDVAFEALEKENDLDHDNDLVAGKTISLERAKRNSKKPKLSNRKKKSQELRDPKFLFGPDWARPKH